MDQSWVKMGAAPAWSARVERGTGTRCYLLGAQPNSLGLWEPLEHLITRVSGFN